jgi:hypothetical protein
MKWIVTLFVGYAIQVSGVHSQGINPILLEWISHRYDTTYLQSSEIDFEAAIHSSHPLKTLTVSISDSQGRTLSKTTQPIADVTEFHLSKKVVLSELITILSVEATDSKGNQSISTRTFITQEELIKRKIETRSDKAIIFATDNYMYWPKLANPIFDSQALATLLNELYVFNVEVVKNPTQEQIMLTLKKYSSRVYGQFDQLLVVFAGHGFFDRSFSEGYIVASDSKYQDTSNSTLLPHSSLRQIVDNIPVDHLMLVMDACFSGSFEPLIDGRGNELYGNANTVQVVARKLSRTSRFYLTSGGKEYVSDGIPGMHSPFMNQLIEVLKSKGGADSILTTAELFASMESLKKEPRFGNFGKHEPFSDFIFISKN